MDLKLGNALGGLGLYRRHATGNISPHLSSHPQFPSISSLTPLKLNLTYFIVLDIYDWLRYSTISNITPLTNKTTRDPVNLQAHGKSQPVLFALAISLTLILPIAWSVETLPLLPGCQIFLECLVQCRATTNTTHLHPHIHFDSHSIHLIAREKGVGSILPRIVNTKNVSLLFCQSDFWESVRHGKHCTKYRVQLSIFRRKRAIPPVPDLISRHTSSHIDLKASSWHAIRPEHLTTHYPQETNCD